MTEIERTFSCSVVATIRSAESRSKACRTSAPAASVAKPRRGAAGLIAQNKPSSIVLAALSREWRNGIRPKGPNEGT